MELKINTEVKGLVRLNTKKIEGEGKGDIKSRE